MKKIACIATAILLQVVCLETVAERSLPAAAQAARQPPAAGRPAGGLRFEKMSDHVHFLQPKDDGANITAVSGQEGFLLINPPAEPELQPVMDAVRRIGARPVRWVLNTDYMLERNGGGTTLLAQGAALLASKELRQLAAPAPPKDVKEPTADLPGKSAAGEEPRTDPGPRIAFTRLMRLFPDNLEIRIVAIQHKARTAGDIVVFIPAEKVLITGDMFESGSFPEIDSDGGGTALGWIDGLKQAIDTVPLLKSAMPQPKPDPNKPPPEEKTLEEQVTVIPGRGPRSNLQEMKDLAESALKLRSELSKAVGAGRSRESALNASSLTTARSLANFDSFANRLFDELSAQKVKQTEMK
jgi:glyoxylase-like metal-dependent hydrolase (beta-lactamase superfamily II)